MKKYLGKIDKKVCHGSGGFTEEEIMQGHKKIPRDPKEGERSDANVLAQIQELNRKNQEMMPSPEPETKKEKTIIYRKGGGPYSYLPQK